MWRCNAKRGVLLLIVGTNVVLQSQQKIMVPGMPRGSVTDVLPAGYTYTSLLPLVLVLILVVLEI
jgi:hypothetical protein